MTDLSVIIVNYNVKELLEQCINSIITSGKNLKIEIIVVDNNSFDGSVEYLKAKFPDQPTLKFISNTTNVGFAKANNIGVKDSAGKYVLILNPDTVLQEDTLEKCISFYENGKDMGALTCKLLLPNGRLDLACRRSFPTPSVALYRMLGLSKLFPGSKTFGKYNLTYLDEDKTYEVDAIVGAFMLIKRDIYDKVGGFDEDYFMYGEDLDLCYRIKKAGYKIFYFSDTSIIHYKGESTKKSSISYVNNFYGAMQIFVKKNMHANFWLINLMIDLSIYYRSFISYFKRFLAAFYPVFLDLIFIVLAMIIAIKQRFEQFPLEAYTTVILIYCAIWLITLAFSGSYSRLNKLSFVKPLNGILVGFFVNSAFTYFFNEFAFSRAVVIRTAFYAFVLIAFWRLVLKIVNYSKRKNILSTEAKTLIVGKNDESETFVNKLRKRIDSEYDVVGYISTNGGTGKEFVGNLNNLSDVIAANKVKNILFAKNELSNQQILDFMWKLRKYNLNFKILSADNDILLGKTALDKIDEIYLMQIEYNINRKINIFVKRLFDLFFGVLSLFTIYPVSLIAVKMIKKGGEGAKFFNKLLLIPSVVTGKYSFVGRATWDASAYGKEYLGKNGLTGLAQINFYRNLSSDEFEYYNYYYAKNQSLSLDIEIILKTVSLFLFKRNLPRL